MVDRLLISSYSTNTKETKASFIPPIRKKEKAIKTSVSILEPIRKGVKL